MVNYNMTGFTDSVNILEMFSALNTSTNNYFSYAVVISIFVIVLFSMLRNNPPAESFASASTVLTVFSLMFLLAGLIDVTWVIGSSILMAGAIVKLYFT